MTLPNLSPEILNINLNIPAKSDNIEAINNFVEKGEILGLINILENYNDITELSDLEEILFNNIIKEKLSVKIFEKKIVNSLRKINKTKPAIREKSLELLSNLLNNSKTKFDNYHKKNIQNIIEDILSLVEEETIIDSINKLEECGTNINQLNSEDFSLLHFAVVYEMEKVVNFLLEKGADVKLGIIVNEPDSGKQVKFTVLDSLSHSMRNQEGYNKRLFVRIISEEYIPNFNNIPSDIRKIFIQECRKNQPLIENKIFSKIFNEVKANFEEKHVIYSIFLDKMIKAAEENIFLLQYNEEKILRDKISLYCRTNILEILEKSNEVKLPCEEADINDIKPSHNFPSLRKILHKQI